VPVLENAREYLARGFRPTGTLRNVETFRKRVDVRVSESELLLLCDAQTSGGLLMAVPPERLEALETRLRQSGLFYATIGTMTDQSGKLTLVP
jgi:selenide,water dikinase